jgi:hypothetical protein
VLVEGIDTGTHTAQHLLAGYCVLLYERYGTYEEVARHTGLDRRTVKKYIRDKQTGQEQQLPPGDGSQQRRTEPIV